MADSADSKVVLHVAGDREFRADDVDRDRDRLRDRDRRGSEVGGRETRELARLSAIFFFMAAITDGIFFKCFSRS